MTALSRQMATRLQSWRTWLSSADRGATGVEYGIMIAAIAAVIIVAAIALGSKAVEGFDFVNGKL